MTLKHGTIGFFLLLGMNLHAGQPSRVSFENLSRAEGLSQASIFAIHQDRRGYLWLATQEGVNIYDGESFKVLRHRPFDDNSLWSNWIHAFYEEHDGHMWVSTREGLNRVSPDFRHVERLNLEGIDQGRNLLSMLHDAQDRIWYSGVSRGGANGGGLFQYDPKTGTSKNYPLPLGIMDDFVEPSVFHLYQDRNNTIWAMPRGAGLIRFNEAKDAFEAVTEPNSPRSFYFSSQTAPSRYRVWEDEYAVWFAGLGVYRFDKAAQTFRAYGLGNKEELEWSIFGHITGDDQGNIWAVGRSALHIDANTHEETFFRHDPKNPSTPGPGFYNGCIIDRAGIPWVISVTGSVMQFDYETNRFYTFSNETHSELSQKPLFVITEDAGGVIWFGGNATGLYKYSPAKHKFRNYLGKGYQGMDEGAMIWEIEEARNGNFWVGTQGQGIFIFNPDLSLERRITHRSQDAPILGDNIGKMMENADGSWWMTHNQGNGIMQAHLSLYHPEKGVLKRFATPFAAVDTPARFKDGQAYLYGSSGIRLLDEETGALPSPRLDGNLFLPGFVWDVLENDDGSLWIAGMAGLRLVDFEEGSHKIYVNDPKNPKSISFSEVMHIHREDAQTLWLATFGGGLNRFDIATETFTHFTSSDGLPNDVIYGVIPGGDALFLPTNNGLSRFHPKTREIVNYSVSDGLQDYEFNSGAFTVSRSGQLLMGGLNGFNAFYPEELDALAPAPRTVIGVSKNEGEFLGHDVTEAQELHLSSSDRSIEFRFVAMDFNDPASNRYQYQLEGFDPEWIDADRERKAVYTNLDPGSYTFLLKAANGEGVWSDVQRIKLVVDPDFFETNLFRVVVVLGLLLLVAGLMEWQRRRYVFRRQEILRTREAERRRKELEYARDLQLGLLPSDALDNPSLELVGRMKTAGEVGGDYYDFFTIDEHRICIAYGDATGHGVAAGLVVGMVKMAATLWAANPTESTGQMMKKLNQALRATLPKRDMGMALGLAVMDTRTGQVTISSSGMPFPFWYGAEADELKILELKSPPLGYLREVVVQEKSVDLQPGDVLVLLSDGFVERFNPEDRMWGPKALKQNVLELCQRKGSAAGIAEKLIERCDQFARGRANDDDMTVVITRFQPTSK